MDGESDAWFDRELAGCSFADERLNKRLHKLVAQIGSAMGQSIPLVCQDWANTKAAYRFFSNDRVSEADILAGHFQSTRDRTVATDGPVLVLHDTTEFTYQRESTDAIGITKSINSGRDKAGRLSFSVTRHDASTSAIARATFTSCSARPRKPERIS
jgi:Transposase DNA-binding